MKTKWFTLAALVLALSPALALAHPTPTSGAHMRPNLYHDRSPKLHEHSSVAHH